MVKLLTVRPSGKDCAQVTTPFEQTIPLNTADLPAGEYTVKVNGVSAVFTLPSGENQTPVAPPSGESGLTKTFNSDIYHYQVSYPADWTVQVNTTEPAGAGKMPEYVTFASGPDGKLPNMTIYALTGVPPFTGYENCQSNLVFRGLDACRISVPAGQIPPTELVIFHNGDQNFEIVMQYEDQKAIETYDLFLTSFQFNRPVAAGPTVPVMKTYASKQYGYRVNYPSGWSMKVETSETAGSGKNLESVTFTPQTNGSLINIAIHALTGAAPFTGYENCDQNFVFRDLKACRISVPAGQIPPTELLIFQKGDAHFEIAMAHLDQKAVSDFDQFLTSFEFFTN